ncbi:MAG: hypothetical protein GYA50_05575 [Eubacteriaceae bacterium]|nr:hypothetical protein [Eubacteriaceae bacterium]
MNKVKMYIEGIDQSTSANSIKSVLESLGETKNVKVDSASGTAVMDTTQRDERLKIAVEDLGCRVTRITPIE